jgi:hypothetical protein
VVAEDHDVRGLQIAVDDASLVGGGQTCGHVAAIDNASGTGNLLRSFSLVARSEPSKYGIVMYLMPPISRGRECERRSCA